MTALNRYTCEEAFRRIDDYLDRELSPEEMTRVHEHLELCEGCAREFRFEESLLNGVKRKLRQIDVPDGLQARLLSVLEREG
jgi:anti-sigma factor (TIGR02949 family)